MRRMISSGIKQLLISFAVLVSIASYSYAGGFYVIPIPTDNCNCDCDGGSGTPVGSKAFVLEISSNYGEYLKTGEIYSTTGGKLIEITGATAYDVYYPKDTAFLVAPSTLPDPSRGTKGPYYHLRNGYIVYAKYL